MFNIMCTFDRYKNQETGKDVRNDDIKLVYKC